MRDVTIDAFLTGLAARVPAPGGGASAALHAAQAAALLGMVARYSTGEKYAAHAEPIARITAETDRLRATAVQSAQDDAEAFTAVTDAYKLPRTSDAEKEKRSAAIATALRGAADVPARVIALATRLVELAEEILPLSNRNVSTDVAAAAEAARAAVATARVNVEVNLAGIKDESTRDALRAAIADVDAVASRAERVTSDVRRQIAD
ncbi:cyclodeaminase/cyclohydrolase family protein [Streptomyces sp. NPDC102467]|uniref:cyclodeaminase/cyclohydrolase family protein n=1 Tax=Streptomyces sp. NPDC102467 TaxID=3366179 RepID=UPI00381BDE09